MKRLLLGIALMLAVAIGLQRISQRRTNESSETSSQNSLAEVRAAPAVLLAPNSEAPPLEVVVVPTFFPKAKLIAKVTEAFDSRGRQRVIETVETTMHEPYVRVERTFQRTATGKRRQLGGEIAMVANQLLLEKPDSVSKLGFEGMLRKAGAQGVSEIGEAYLATFAADPTDPRALDAFMKRVREVAGADLIVEPNYIRKMF